MKEKKIQKKMREKIQVTHCCTKDHLKQDANGTFLVRFPIFTYHSLSHLHMHVAVSMQCFHVLLQTV